MSSLGYADISAGSRSELLLVACFYTFIRFIRAAPEAARLGGKREELRHDSERLWLQPEVRP